MSCVDNRWRYLMYIFIQITRFTNYLNLVKQAIGTCKKLEKMEFDIRRASLISDKINEDKSDDPKTEPISELEAPKDNFFLAFLFSFFSGIAGLIPLSFFLTANDYWMYKLRDPANESYDLNNKTFLQTMFATMNTITNAVPSVLSVILTISFGHKMEMRTRFLMTLGIISFMFIVFTILVKVNTDSWQNVFFATAQIVLSLISLCSPMYNMSVTSFISRFPHFYLRMLMFGLAFGGLFGSILQIISLSIGNDSVQVALIYFISGTVVMCFTFLLTYLMKYSPLINFYANSVEQSKKPTYTFKEYFEVSKRVWPLPLMILVTHLMQGMTHPNITNLVVSEGYSTEEDNLWYNKYFVVVATYLQYDFFQLMGRFFARPMITKKNYPIFIAIVIARSFVLCPLFLFCNAQPRNHLPVWFPHDYQYMIIHATMSLSMSVLSTSIIMSVSNFAGDKTEMGITFIIGFIMCTSTALSPIGSLFVTIL